MLPKIYEPRQVEDRWSEKWQEKKLFLPDNNSKKESFTIVIPPPNITGALHMGHALNNILQDTLIRYKKMTGFNAYWVPGTDHGGIATQNVLEKQLEAQGKKKEDLGREEFLRMTWAWYLECGDGILNQLKKLGCALDISRENVRFTMDEKRAEAVFEAFKHLWKKKYIYRGERMINWCPRCGTALSDIEVEYKEEKSKLWHIKYPFENGKGALVVATTRPETMLGDTAVAVNPEDERYSDIVGNTLKLPLTDRLIPVIKDKAVEMEFGTGAVKITPSHDPLDFEICQRHNLESLKVISYEGRMVNCPRKYLGRKTQEARRLIVKDLSESGYLIKEEPYKHSVSICYRCRHDIEPLVSEQWFVRMEELAKPALKAAQNEDVKFYPASWKKPFIQWLENIRDWCISRQIWWGHRIPVWYCEKCSAEGLKFNERGTLSRVSFKNGAQPVISFEKPACPKCGSKDTIQDPDVLDTWFSSALWPFSVFGWPSETEELKKYYPTSVLVTGYEILYLWVARMVMSAMEHMEQIPFSSVYIHGTVRDKKGKKMSKSLGNVIDPLEMTAKYGADAIRFSMIQRAIGGKDMQFSEEMLIGGRNFINKIYNVMRFILMRLDGDEKINNDFDRNSLDISDKWLFHRYNETLKSVKFHMDNFDASNALNSIYGFVWDDFCDWYIELAKPRLETAERKNVLSIIVKIFSGCLKTLHPFTPYITEELYQNLKIRLQNSDDFIINETMDAFNKDFENIRAEKEMSVIMDIILKVRAIRSQFEISPAKKIEAVISTEDEYFTAIINKNAGKIKYLAKLDKLDIRKKAEKPAKSASAISGPANIYVPLGNFIDMEKERARIIKEYEKTVKEMAYSSSRLKNANFIKRAPEKEIAKIRQRREDSAEKAEKLKVLLEDLK